MFVLNVKIILTLTNEFIYRRNLEFSCAFLFQVDIATRTHDRAFLSTSYFAIKVDFRLLSLIVFRISISQPILNFYLLIKKNM